MGYPQLSTGQIVVMGAVSRSGLRRVLIGNTAESLLDRAREGAGISAAAVIRELKQKEPA